VKAALFHEHGGPEVVRVEDVPVPEPGAGQVRLRVVATAMNHLDLWVRRGLPIETTMPHIGGSDIAGVVDALGDGVDDVAPGARVVVDPTWSCGACEWCAQGEEPLCVKFRIIGEHTPGGIAEYVVVPAANLFAVPDDFPLERAAAAPLAFLTAWRGLVTRGALRVRRGRAHHRRIGRRGHGGGADREASRRARVRGDDGGERGERARAGRRRRLRPRARGLVAGGVADTGKRGVDVIFDSVGEATFMANVRAASRLGRIVIYGATTGAHAQLDLRHLFWKQLDLRGTTMSNRREFAAVMRLVFDGTFEPVIDVTWPLERARAAHERLEAGKQFGSIVLRP
jgi:NADPH:quinone reductase-like Zn-dependent oxidoreductase